jgi:ABC-2 type transport system ATP-binding protein
LSEMEDTADHVLVIGRGRLIADVSVDELTSRSSASHVRVVSPEAAKLSELLANTIGKAVTSNGDGGLVVSGVGADYVGDLAAAHGIRLHELTPRRATLEEAFMELTRDSIDYRGGMVG